MNGLVLLNILVLWLTKGVSSRSQTLVKKRLFVKQTHIPLWLLLVFEEILFLLVTFLFHPSAVRGI